MKSKSNIVRLTSLMGICALLLLFTSCRQGTGFSGLGASSSGEFHFKIEAGQTTGVHKVLMEVPFDHRAEVDARHAADHPDLEGLEFTGDDLTSARENGGHVHLMRVQDSLELFLNNYVGRIQIRVLTDYTPGTLISQMVPPYDADGIFIPLPVTNDDLTETLRDSPNYFFEVEYELLESPAWDCDIVLQNSIQTYYQKEYEFKQRRGKQIVD